MSKKSGQNLRVKMFHLRQLLYRRGSKRAFLCLALIVVVICVIDITGVYRHALELDYETQFSYPLEYPDFIGLVQKFRKKEPVPVKPINLAYSNFSFLAKADEGCNSKKFRLIILVKSAPTNFKKRAVIRSTWGYPRRFSDVAIKTVFLLGQVPNPKTLTTALDGKIRPLEYTITAEMGRYEDIVRADFLDSYYNNTIKIMTGMRWLVEVCTDYRFALFVDDDMYVSVKNLLKYVRNPTEYPEYWEKQKKIDLELLRKYGKSDPGTTEKDIDKNELGRKVRSPTTQVQYSSTGRKESWRIPAAAIVKEQKAQSLKNNPIDFDIDLSEDAKLYTGSVYYVPPHRHRLGTKWYIPISDYPFNYYPPYVPAGSIVLSKLAVLDMYYASFYTKPLPFDDVFIALLAKKMNIEPYHSDYFKFSSRIDDDPYSSEYEYLITKHGFENPEELKQLWNLQKSLSRA